MTDSIRIRKGQAPQKLEHDEFLRRLDQSFHDPKFDGERPAIARIAEIAWHNYKDSRKAPAPRKAGPEFADLQYDLSVEWLKARERIRAASEKQREPFTPSRVLVIVGSLRNDGSCPGENSKTFVLARLPVPSRSPWARRGAAACPTRARASGARGRNKPPAVRYR